MGFEGDSCPLMRRFEYGESDYFPDVPDRCIQSDLTHKRLWSRVGCWLVCMNRDNSISSCTGFELSSWAFRFWSVRYDVRMSAYSQKPTVMSPQHLFLKSQQTSGGQQQVKSWCLVWNCDSTYQAFIISGDLAAGVGGVDVDDLMAPLEALRLVQSRIFTTLHSPPVLDVTALRRHGTASSQPRPAMKESIRGTSTRQVRGQRR